MVKKILLNSSYDLEAVEKFLEKAAAEGLMFVKKDGMRFFFEKCEPRQLKFSVDVFEKASIFDTRPEPLTEEYIEYCNESGWVHCGTYGKLQMFYSENINAVPIRTDEERLKSVHKNTLLNEGVNWLLYVFMFFVFSVMNLANWGLARGLIEEYYMVLAGVVYLLFALVDISRYLYFYIKNKKNVKDDKKMFFYSIGFVRVHHFLRILLFGSALLVLLYNLASEDALLVLAIIGLLLVIFIVIFIVEKLRGKRENSSRENNITTSVVLVVILCAVMFYVPILFIIGGSFLDPNVEKVSYYDKWENAEAIMTLSKDEIPFNYENIGIELSDVKYISTEKDEYSSVFGTMDSWDETVHDSEMNELLYLSYDVLKTQHSAIIESHIDKIVDDSYNDVTNDWCESWEAKKVYYSYEMDWEYWIVEYDDVVVEITSGNVKLDEAVIKNIVVELEKYYEK